MNALVLFFSFRLVHHVPQPDHVLQAIAHPGLGRLAVAARAAGLLVVGLDALGQIAMRHKTNVRLVYPHSKSDGGHHDGAICALKMGLA